MTTRILLADDHEIVRRGLRRLLEARDGWEICAEAADGRQAVELAISTRPDVAVIDMAMPVLSGLEATRQIRKALPRTEVLAFTMSDSETLIKEVLQAGARGYCSKSEAGAQVVNAVEALARHQPFLSSKASEIALDTLMQGDVKFANPLTPREREVVQLIAEGRSNKEIATRLELGVKTVETHRSALMRKLGLRSTADVVRYAVRNNFVQP